MVGKNYNTFRPTALVPRPYGWKGAPAYNRADVRTALAGERPSGMSQEEFQRSLAYEWLESNSVAGSGWSNPPFLTGASGRLHPLLSDESGQPARILRGFIRRANTEAGDKLSQTRLYFMYNPEQITRDYVSYLDQQALDPFNTVYQSGNLVAPPSYMDFTFELFFDRQAEAMEKDHPGVYVDYQFFDMVVRNVVPQDPASATNAQIPDNGVMMVNPRDITVVFSPQMTVQGRPLNAQISFEKFTHRMTPVRMSISLKMRVMYFGPMLAQSEYRMAQAEIASETIVPYESEFNFHFTYTDITYKQNVANQSAIGAAANALGIGAGIGKEGGNIVPVAGITGGLDRGLAPIVTQMIAAAAQSGISLSGGGYRGSAAQAELRRKNGCPDLTSPSSTCRVPTAPLVNGQSKSEHTKGLAIDFSNCSRGSARFNWLAANAGRYGLRNLPSESWHWSTTGK